jgi:hypothetical protein
VDGTLSSPLSSAEIRNGGPIFALPHPSSWLLLNYLGTDNFTFHNLFNTSCVMDIQTDVPVKYRRNCCATW